MFSLERFKELKANVKHRDDFPVFVQALKKTGISYFETFLEDGHADYYTNDGIKVSTAREYAGISLAEKSDNELLEKSIQLFQKDDIDYLTFCNSCAKSGVEKWVVSMGEMSCSYHNKEGDIMFVETIATPSCKYKKIKPY